MISSFSRFHAISWLSIIFLTTCIETRSGGLPSGWRFVSSLPQGNTLKAVWMAETNHVFIGGEGGTILHWDGANWTTMTTPTRKHIADIHGTSPTDVWAVGGDQYTTDRKELSLIMHYDGKEWKTVAAPDFSGQTYALTSVHALAVDDVWATIKGSSLFHYDGKTWQFVYVPLQVEGSFHKIGSAGQDHLFVVGSHGQILHRQKGVWALEQKTESGNFTVNILSTLLALDADHVYAGNNWGTFYQRQPNGTWTNLFETGGLFGGDGGITAIEGDSPTNLLVATGYTLRRYNGTLPPERFDLNLKKFGTWYAGDAKDGVSMLVGDKGVTHEVVLPREGVPVISALNAGNINTIQTTIKGTAAYGNGGLLIYGGSQYAGQTTSIYYFDGISSLPFPMLPPDLTSQNMIAGMIVKNVNDIILIWNGTSSRAGGIHRWNGIEWQTIGAGYGMPEDITGYYQSPSGKIYVHNSYRISVIDGTNNWFGLFPFGTNPAESAYTAIAGRSDNEIYLGLANGKIMRYNGSQWIKESSPSSDSISAIACSTTDTYAVGNNNLACRRVNGVWQALTGIEKVGEERFDCLLAVSNVVYASRTTYSGYTDGGKGEIWKFSGGTASRFINALSTPLVALGLTSKGHIYGIGNGRFIITDAPAPTNSFLGRVTLSTQTNFALGNMGLEIRATEANASRSLVAAYRTDQAHPAFAAAFPASAANQYWTVIQETATFGTILPPLIAQVRYSPELIRNGLNINNAFIFTPYGQFWTNCPSAVDTAQLSITTLKPISLGILSIGPGYAIELPPAMSVSYTDAGQIRISWPATAAQYQLELNEFLATPGNWQNSSLQPILDNNEYYIMIKPEKTCLFFRLRGQ